MLYKLEHFETRLRCKARFGTRIVYNCLIFSVSAAWCLLCLFNIERSEKERKRDRGKEKENQIKEERKLFFALRNEVVFFLFSSHNSTVQSKQNITNLHSWAKEFFFLSHSLVLKKNCGEERENGENLLSREN